jgi:hypothetical protein
MSYLLKKLAMPESRKRKGHPFVKHSDIPNSQRAKGRFLWAILIGIFALIIAYFAFGPDYIVLALALMIGAAAGFFIGKAMEMDMKK